MATLSPYLAGCRPAESLAFTQLQRLVGDQIINGFHRIALQRPAFDFLSNFICYGVRLDSVLVCQQSSTPMNAAACLIVAHVRLRDDSLA